MTVRSLDSRITVIFIVFLADFLNNLELLDAVMIGGLHVYIFDVLSLMLLALSFPYWISIKGKSKAELLLTGLFWVSIAAFITGFMENSFTAGVAYRQDFTMFALMFYVAASRQRISLRSLAWIVGLYSSFGIMEGVLRAADIVQQESFVMNLNVSEISFVAHRLIGLDASLAIAGLALILFTVAMMGIVKGNRRVFIAIAAVIALAISIADMNRSVWLAAIGGLITLALITKWHGSFRGRLQFNSVMVIVVICGASILWSMQSHFLIQAFSEVSQENSTANWRIIGWMGLIDKVSGLHVLWGMGYGADQTRIIFEQEVKNSAHNLFVHYYFYMGFIGLFMYLAFIYEIWKGLRKAQANAHDYETRNLATALMALFVLLFVYHMAYSQWLLDAIVYGYSIRFLRQYGRRVQGNTVVSKRHISHLAPKYGKTALPRTRSSHGI